MKRYIKIFLSSWQISIAYGRKFSIILAMLIMIIGALIELMTLRQGNAANSPSIVYLSTILCFIGYYGISVLFGSIIGFILGPIISLATLFMLLFKPNLPINQFALACSGSVIAAVFLLSFVFSVQEYHSLTITIILGCISGLLAFQVSRQVWVLYLSKQDIAFKKKRA